MSENLVPNSLKHGAFSEILILPGESAHDFEQLKNDLFAEYKPSGISEERALIAVAKSLWQERRLALYQHVQHARAAKLSSKERGNPNAMNEAIQQFCIKKGLVGPGEVDPKPEVPAPPPKSAEERINDELLELGNLLTLEQLEKELDVEFKLQTKTDRLFKRFFQIKTMKQIAGLTAATPAALKDPAPVLELTAQEPT
jgi:hypothetical protein